MAYSIKHSQEEMEERQGIENGANSHIKSLQVALKKYAEGSDVEGQYAEEHYNKLGHYIKKVEGKI